MLLTWLESREPLSVIAQRHHVARQTAHDRLRVGKRLARRGARRARRARRDRRRTARQPPWLARGGGCSCGPLLTPVLRTDVRISGFCPALPLTLEVARFHGGGDHNTTARDSRGSRHDAIRPHPQEAL
ncbi:hypothetical protein [Nocardioides convexus]|uniref:hypothetical protein n=1 Tax=Nocardioides convexus TaxID=2712224 RepID=UPI00241895C1|nr:hypothetical protein [Nocardioides convexus]